MSENNLFFKIDNIDVSSDARCGTINTAHGPVETPVFMPVATQGAVKGISISFLKSLGIRMFISNAYHLCIRPGADIVKRAGGLHGFTGWPGGITTDSGGFQIFSLSKLRSISERGVEFRSHLDGTKHFFSPENVVDLQIELGSDIMMPLDECVKYPSERTYVEDSVELTLRWLKRSKKAFMGHPGSSKLFGIVQGGTYKDLRKMSAERTVELDMDGYSLGGIAVGEPTGLLRETAAYTTDFLPPDKIRYLMGVGTPSDILEAVSCGIDMFDCVLPTRNGRNGQAFTSTGELNLKNASCKEDALPIEPGCGCPACTSHSRGYIRHLFNTGEMNGPILVTQHNLHFYAKLMKDAREAIVSGRFSEFKKKALSRI